MNLARYQHQGNVEFGVVQDEDVFPLKHQEQFRGRSTQLIMESLAGMQTCRCEDSGIPIDQVKLLAPVASPEKIICIGRNYADHAREMGSEVAELPIVFSKFANAIANPHQDIVIPSISEQVDFEAELVVVVGRGGARISKSAAMDHVLGVCCGNDVSARDWQKGRPGGQWLVGKSFDSFAPIGPWIVTRDAIDIGNLSIQLTLNGEVMQQSNTSQLIFKIDELISHISQFFSLQPGDLLFTGTPSGVGAGRTPPRFLKAGDETTVEIDGVGRLTNQFV